MYDDDDCDGIATDIALWESVALQLPLPEVCALLTASQHDLAECLITFNEVYLSHPDPDESGLTLAQAIGGVARRATATAIFALAITERTHLTAQHN